MSPIKKNKQKLKSNKQKIKSKKFEHDFLFKKISLRKSKHLSTYIIIFSSNLKSFEKHPSKQQFLFLFLCKNIE